MVKFFKSVKTAMRHNCKGLEKGQRQTIYEMRTHADFVKVTDKISLQSNYGLSKGGQIALKSVFCKMSRKNGQKHNRRVLLASWINQEFQVIITTPQTEL